MICTELGYEHMFNVYPVLDRLPTLANNDFLGFSDFTEWFGGKMPDPMYGVVLIRRIKVYVLNKVTSL